MTNSYNIATIAGARPNFMKVAPIIRALDRKPHLSTTLIHTGQHYDSNLSEVFFQELGIREPDVTLRCGGSTHGEQTARILEQTEKVLLQGAGDGSRYAAVVVVGDVNSTLAVSLAASKIGIPVAHVEAGLRSFDRTMPEEINRIVTDSISEILLASEPAAIENLRREGKSDDHIHLVGNVMIDTLLENLPIARTNRVLEELGLEPGSYATVTLHRPSNVDDPLVLERLMNALIDVSCRLPIVFPVHPRTSKQLKTFGLMDRLVATESIRVTQPLGYQALLCLNSQARVVITDSGGLQEETTALGVPCLTLRENTERPITITEGTSTLIGNDPNRLQDNLESVLNGTYKKGRCPELWDGHAAERIADVLAEAVDAKE